MSGFQTVIYREPAPAIEGDWCSANPHFSMLAGPGRLTAGPAGVTVGRFAWADADGVVGVGGNGRIGFVQIDQLALITQWLGTSGMTIPPGYEMTLYDSADVWCRFAGGAQIGQKVYANFADGSASAAAAGAPSGSTATTFSIAPGTFAVTGSIESGVLSVSAVGSGIVYPGSIIAGAGIPTAEQVAAQILPLLAGETLGGIGRYLLTEDDGTLVVSEAITGSYGLLTVGGTVTGAFNVGAPLSGTGVSGSIWANSANGSALTGAGGAGTYVVSPSQTAATGTLTAATNAETRWFIDSFAEAGELAMISTHG